MVTASPTHCINPCPGLVGSTRYLAASTQEGPTEGKEAEAEAARKGGEGGAGGRGAGGRKIKPD